ncbi:RNA polymerase sigma-70 factor [Hallella bergensis]|uniref:RNA polymerase sigma-70 factor n=1 Tax=Hallella bergensis TaxID=242750 RepID=UPI003990904A
MDFNQNEIRKLAEGDVRIFTALYQTFFQKIHQFALMLLKDNQDAEDVCQIIFMKVWQKRKSLLEVTNIDSYLFILSKNSIIDYLSSKKIKNDYSNNIPNIIDTITPYENLVASDMQLLIDMVVDSMPEQRQIIYRMSREQHLNNKEIATKLSIKKKTVENHLNLALKDIKKVLFFIPSALFLLGVIYPSHVFII